MVQQTMATSASATLPASTPKPRRRGHIHSLYEFIFRFTRTGRMRRFETAMEVRDSTQVLDVGGTPFNWRLASRKPRVILLNLPPIEDEIPPDERSQLEYVEGDACSLEYDDQSFDVAFSNSVIEHVHTWENQLGFAAEVRRVGKKLWIQTPSYWFPIEPHYLTPFVHWLPKSWRRRVLRNFSTWGWIERPSQETVDGRVDEIRLLTRREMQQLFPDCEIVTERFLLIPKSYIAVRR